MDLTLRLFTLKIPTCDEPNFEATSSGYKRLERLLKGKRFKEADSETNKVMLAVTNRESEGCLRYEDTGNSLEFFELRTIDNLWLKYSQGKFGISVQQEIYETLGGTKELDLRVWNSFGKKLGWREAGHWIDYNRLNFSLSAPTGHLPYIRFENEHEQARFLARRFRSRNIRF